MKSKLKAVTLTLLMISSIVAVAQGNGIQPGSVQVGGPDVLGMNDLNIHLTIPLVSKQGIGMPFSMGLSFNNNFWNKVGSQATWSQQNTFAPIINNGWWIFDGSSGGAWSELTSPNCPGGANEYIYYSYIDPNGTPHKFNGSITLSNNPAGCAPTSATQAFADGSGLTATVYAPGAGTSSVKTPSGVTLSPRGAHAGPANSVSGNTVVDTNGNTISWNDTTKSYTDTLGVSELTRTGSGTPSSPYIYTYPTQSGTGTASVKVNYAPYTMATNFACANVTEYPPTATNLVSSVTLGDGSQYAFTYETTPGDVHSPHYVTGRLASVTWPTGGTTTYTYSNGTSGNAVVCSDGSVPGLIRQTPDGTWTYARVVGLHPTTTVTGPVDAAGHKSITVYTMTGSLFGPWFEAQKQVFQDSTSGAVLLTAQTCYNGNTVNCATAGSPSLPITQNDIYITPGGMTQSSRATTLMDASGNVTQMNAYDFGGTLIRQTVTPVGSWNGSSCIAIANGIKDRTCYRNVYDSANNIKQSQAFTYDTHGNLISNIISPVANVGAPGNLTKSYIYNANGTLNTFTDVNGAQTTYAYNGTGGCNNGFATTVTKPLGLIETYTFDCNGAVIASARDANQQLTTFGYNDPLWRLTSKTDPLTNVATTHYSTNSTESLLNFGTSTIDLLNRTDSLGRVIVAQRRQGPAAANGDTTITTYDSNGRPLFSSLPFSCAWGSTSCSNAIGRSVSYDALNRVTGATDSGGSSLNTVFSSQDMVSTLGPAPAGELVKKAQSEQDGLGRKKSKCLISGSTSNTLCSQATGGYSGYPTAYNYDTVDNVLSETRSSSSGSQSKSFTYDALGRVLTAAYPESGTTQLFYDTAPSTPGAACPGTYNGDLVKEYDANGNTICYTYDGLHRTLSITYTGPNSIGVNKYFVYDTATVNGAAMQNGTGRIVEAYTAATQGGTKITDIGYSYDVVGQLTDVYESTPHSGGYYHVNASFWPNGAVNVLNGGTSKLPGLPTITYGLDGEGRTKTVSASTGVNPVTSTSYNNFNRVTDVTFGSADTAHFGFDLNTGRVTQYKATINGTAMHGDLTWSANGSLRSLSITDPFNASDAQTCNYGTSTTPGYDDVGRLVSVNCGSAWSQSFTYDAFGNIAKSGSISWMPGYNQANNQYLLSGTSYDAKGELLADTFHTYTWDVDGRPTTIDAISVTYDALGRMVEENKSGTYTQFVYAVGQKLAIMNGQTLSKAFVPLPGGTQVKYDAGGISTYRVPDWLGSLRIGMNPNRTYSWGQAFAPYGERYAISGGPAFTFTGQTADTVSDEYDFLYRELHSSQGRWISPDPAHAGWNAYEYVGSNPLVLTDSAGLAAGDYPQMRTGFRFPHPHRPSGDGEGRSGGTTCIMDGIETDCDVVESAVGAGAAVVCPDGCSVVGADGRPMYFFASTEGSGGYYDYSGPGALYYSVESAGLGASNYLMAQFSPDFSHDMHEYESNLYEDANEVFSYTPAQQGAECSVGESCDESFDFGDIPAGTTLVGSAHTHPQIGYGDTEFSGEVGPGDIKTYMTGFSSPIFGFVVTSPGNRVLMFNPIAFAGWPGNNSNPECVLQGDKQGVPSCH
jgi:RHS repeat-associated protein